MSHGSPKQSGEADEIPTMPDSSVDPSGCMELTVGHDNLLTPAQQYAVHQRVVEVEMEEAKQELEMQEEVKRIERSAPFSNYPFHGL